MATTTTTPPTPATLTTWEEAFTHPLPTVLTLEKQLRSHMTENRTKLRTLVGSSYRDLLGTAEKIIEMDGQIRSVEGMLGGMGRRCNSGVVERGWDGLKGRKGVGKGDKGREGWVVNVRVLRGVVGFVGRVVRNGGSGSGRGDALTAAKVLVLGRLVLKGLGEKEEGKDGVLVEEMRRKLGSVRRRLLGDIARRLVRRGGGEEEEEEEDKERTVKTLCAYSLISSAGPRDVLRYFMQVRFEQLETKAEEGDLVSMLDLYSQTLLDTKELFPRRFAEALAALAKATLVKDKDVRAVQELSLDVYEQWIEEDVRNFHPYVRHDQLSTGEVGDALAAWTRQAQECLLHGLRDALEKQTDMKEVLEVRQKVLSKYLALSARVRSDAHAKALEDIRAAFLKRLEELAAQAAKIAGFDVADHGSSEMPAASMWDLATADLDLNNGAIQFRQAVIHRQHGHSPSIATVTTALDKWIERLQGFTEFISSMRTIKWDDDLDLELDDLTDGESLQVILSKKDPQLLETRLHEETTTALEETYRQVEKCLESEHNPTILIRVVREVDRRRRGLGDRFEKLSTVKADPTFIAALHRQVAVSIAEESVKQFSKSVQKRSHTPVTLWDGTPPLPVQPSPATFRFLKTLHKHMSSAGTDLWSPDAVQALKAHVAEQVAAQPNIEKIAATTATEEASLSNGHADQDDKTNEKMSASRDRLVQLQFDVFYLQRVFSSSTGGKLGEVVGEIGRRGKLDDMGSLEVERLRKSAMEYWRRTYLLFGLLAVGVKMS
ncbi:hypothetical protein M409DRAFT_65593 [Zasmidium cellare ATCC 36951]|uniref:Conserved oligomeric Golgi complex subunit 1 n=1 Tax=Zasmidium cellare ATCC 36951 TaxID=1080233 RepID=A0A6A6CLB9_ZASCE|nr:uncharacterized protein M409DRAFT_65593 [Zasmidium cellare ATCC 36951]KAF2168047.1 hypothetical protein M409DRAFT_65593 [Zasmidium cellare ATCC 36951]